MGREKDYYRELSNEIILNLQENTTLKLMDYIEGFLKKGRLKDAAIDFNYTGADEEDAYFVFNTWFSMDYITPYGKSFIRHFLEEKGHKLSEYERKILEDREKSYVSLYEIININRENITVYDLLCKKMYVLYQPENLDLFEIGDIFLSRVANLLGRKKFIGFFQQIDPRAKNLLLNSIFDDYHNLQHEEPTLKIEQYLKKYSNRVYYILDQIYGFSNNEQTNEIENQIKEFENYLRDKKGLTERTIDSHIRNLEEFYYFYLEDSDITLVDINADIIESFIIDGIIDGFFYSKNDLSSNITTLKKFASYLKEKKYIDEEKYIDIIEVLKDKDYYINKFIRYKDVIEHKLSFEDWFADNYQDKKAKNIKIEIDKKLKKIIDEFLEDEDNSFIIDFEVFIDYISKNKVKVTKLNKYIQRKHLLKLNDMMINKMDIKKTVNQIDIPLLHLFYHFSVDNSILIIDDKDNITINTNIHKYKDLSVVEKIAIFIDYIWNKADWEEIGLQDMFGVKEEYKNRNEFAKVLAHLEVDKYYDYEHVTALHKSRDDKFDLFNLLIPATIPGCMHMAHVFNSRILKYFSYLGLLELKFKEDAKDFSRNFGYDIDMIKINRFGQEIFKYLGDIKKADSDKKSKMGKVIDFFTRKKVR